MTRWLLVICTVAAANQAAYAALRVLITYRALDLGVGVVTIGVLAATTAVLPALAALPIGRLVDGGAARPTIIYASLATIAGGAVVAVSVNLAILVIGSIVLGVAQVAGTVAGQGYASIASERHDLDRHFAAWSLSTNLGQVVGLGIVGVTFQLLDEARPVAITVASLAVLGLVAAAVPGSSALPKIAKIDRPDGNRAVPMRGMLRARGMSTALFASMVILAGIDLLMIYLPVLAEQRGISAQIVTMLLAARIGASVVARLALPLLLTRTPRRPVLISSTLCSGVCLLVLPWASDSLGLLAADLVAIGLFWGFGQPMTMTWVVSLVPASEQGAILATRTLANGLAQTLLPLGAGLLAGSTGVSVVFLLAGALSLVASTGTARRL
jgi:MFS family permease